MTVRLDQIPFPCERVPQDPALARLIGLYPQRQEGLWMQRVKALGGALSGRQWRVLGRLARQFTPSAPLHLTTRQDIELHDLSAEAIPAVQERIARAGLTGLGACGDTLRNVTVCPCSGTVSGTVDLGPVAWQIRRTVEAQPGVFSLPRKFKISLSACPGGCGQPWINDLGLVALREGGRWGFSVTAGGSLGAVPATGIRLFDWLPAGDVLPLVAATVRAFERYGDRCNRSRARLRHVRQRLGDEAFAALLMEAFERARAEHDWPPVSLPTVGGAIRDRLTLSFPCGDITPEAAEALSELVGAGDAALRIANHHRVIVFGRDRQHLLDLLAGQPALADAARPQPCIVACPGNRWCSRALVDTNALAARLRAAAHPPPNVTICISGCPNGCAHSAVADVGLTGVLASRDGRKQEAFNLLVGGGMGRDDRLAETVARKLSADEAVEAVARLEARIT